MASTTNEYLHPWEQAIERERRLDFLFRTNVQDILDSYPLGADWMGWPHVYRVLYIVRDEAGGCTSVFGRAYRKRMQLMPGGGGLDMPVWWFDVRGRVPERWGMEEHYVRFVPDEVTEVAPNTYRIDSLRAENVIDQ